MKVTGVTIRKRLIVGMVLISIGFIALIVRLAYVQLWEGKDLANLAEDSWRREIPISQKRGEILDRKGERIAYNISSPTIWAIPVQIEDQKATAAQIAPLLGMKTEDVERMIAKGQSVKQIKGGGRKISLETAEKVRELNLPGIVVAEDNKRYYPYGDLAAHILGFTGIDNQGLTGIEQRYDSALTGLRGNIAYLSDARGNQMPNSSEKYIVPRDGLNLQLTIDKQIQTIMERELDRAMEELKPNQALAIAMDPNTGEILAMASKPSYDPAHYKDFPSDVYDRNLPIWMTYEPGSTFKIITLAAAIQEGKVDLYNEHFFDPGRVEVGGAKLRCWKRGGHGSQTFLEVVQNSCNPGFVALGNRLGKETLFDYIRNFGFGQKTGIDLSGEASGILFKLSRVGPVELATTAFGQGVSVTPIQQITAVSAAINGGKLFKPHVAKSFIQPETGMVVEDIKPELVRQVISPETSSKVRDALEHVVAQGTGRNAFIDGYRVGGKTGTAQKVINGRYSPNEHIVSFVGFAPADDPKVVIYTAVDNPQGIQFGGLVAAPIVKRIMEDTLHYMGVEPRKEQVSRKYRFDETPVVVVPNLVGKTLTDIYEDMNMNFQLAKSGTGNTIIHQAPKPGTRVDRGSTIRIYMGEEKETEE
ncbi:stage V sporulation protein D [Paenibacillus alvei]|uniref:Transpeptidase penicillin-binding protein n=1 Tax=Paenibacillus alvei TaxID=44250 RepID=A0A383R7L4_PAEAL|nr:stage V sporulation protein D [Paenibacillus alvei]SYX82572.1 transpeptidase penicillin-binding protein [Paenibacillus alvei]